MKNDQALLETLQAAAHLSCPTALWRLASIYLDGEIVERNLPMAAALSLKVLEDADALYSHDSEIFPVRTIISHPMETGLRHNTSGLLIPIRIAERFVCRVAERVLFSAKLEPAIATNPYFAFSLRLQQSAKLTFEWTDTTGEVYADRATVEVA